MLHLLESKEGIISPLGYTNVSNNVYVPIFVSTYTIQTD